MLKSYEQTTYEIIDLRPDEIRLDPQYDVRPFSKDFSTPEEDRKIELLAGNMEEMGQMDALLITPDRTLIAGHRRRRAALIINERRSVIGQSLFRLQCRIDASGQDLHRKAIQSNLQRENLSPMDLAYLIVKTRDRFGWKGATYTRHVAKYIGIDTATVSRHEQILRADKDLQNQIHSGTLSLVTGLQMLAVPVEKRAPVLERATEIQKEEDLDRTMSRFQAGKASVAQTTEAITSPKPIRIERNSVIKAIREKATPTRNIQLERAELIKGIGKFDSPGFSSALRDAARYFTSAYAKGRGTWDELAIKFRAATEPQNQSKAS
jgi:ParB-like chromosome segregation protein Spo0J